MAKNKFWLIILFAVLIYLIMGIYANFGDLLSAIEKFNWIFIPVMIILTTIAYFIRFIKWNFFLKSVGVHLNLKDNLFVFFSGLGMIITPAKVGEIWKGWLIKDINGESLSKTVPVVIIDRVTDLIGLIILSLLGILYYKEGSYIIIALIVIFTLFFVAVRSKKVSDIVISVLEKRAGKYSKDIKTMHTTFEQTMQPKNLVGMSFLSVFAWFFECLALYFVIIGFGQSISLIISTFVFSFASLAGAVSMIPGGLGIAEATTSGMLQYFGLTSTISVGVAIIIRFGTLWYGAILGFLVYLIFKKRIMGETPKT
ncbi:MAG: flippase-like domain-containing protein [Methanobacterium sp.]|uniref:lysylphosphatidylglycerol synthase transmembrane domain-containing protein n=1 Tax=Methanobacterium sp. TaxID=2164 RepID=UPI003D6474DF|nr:flippase-like domain-containing protein [Methanobacterium sp.]